MRTLDEVDRDLEAAHKVLRATEKLIAKLEAERIKLERSVIRETTKDNLRQACGHCGHGTYQEMDIWGDTLRCSNRVCGKQIARYTSLDNKSA